MVPIFIAVFLGGCALGAFTTLVVGIHIDERRRGVSDAAFKVRRSEVAARHVMGVYVRKPASTIDTAQKRK